MTPLAPHPALTTGENTRFEHDALSVLVGVRLEERHYVPVIRHEGVSA